ncbi:hypothetical protein AVT97_gp09 [Sulfolobales Virus YNP2]|uniref:hypothetical protein n=1 Tax=Sulfolobales Virus YNP2 TaxID=1732180 RepID=UPI000706A9A8|nr:hypothetical protein AVT97_gp09 [Sulfolobales Virus YNP2]ALG97172.1 hypothetical protein [Sulfolobales Virus YNP2]
MKQLYAVSKFNTLLGMRQLIINAEKNNIDLFKSIKEKRCPVCGKKFSKTFLLKRHIIHSECATVLERRLRE